MKIETLDRQDSLTDPQKILQALVEREAALVPRGGIKVILASLAAAPRDSTDTKPSLAALPTQPATIIEGVFLQGAYLNLECELQQIIDGFDENSLIAGKMLAVHVRETALRLWDLDDQDLLRQNPLLAYLSPGSYAKIAESYSFPFHEGFHQ